MSDLAASLRAMADTNPVTRKLMLEAADALDASTPSPEAETAAVGLRKCPFCGAHPHHGLTKVEHCQLHGEPFQRFRVWCPHGCASKTEVNRDQAFAAWNARSEDSLHARIAELELINANLMGDDERVPRYTTKRLRQEIARATEVVTDRALRAEAIAAEAVKVAGEIETICTESASACRQRMGTRVGNILSLARAFIQTQESRT